MDKQDNEIHVTLGIIRNDMGHMKDSFVKLEKSMENGMSSMKSAMEALAATFKKDYVTQQEFAPVRLIVYGLVGTVLVGVLGALITLVIKK